MKPTLLEVEWDDSQTIFWVIVSKDGSDKRPGSVLCYPKCCSLRRTASHQHSNRGRPSSPTCFLRNALFRESRKLRHFLFISILRTVGGPGRLWSVAERRALAWSCELTVKSHVTITTDIRPSKALHHLRSLFRKRDTQVVVYNEDVIAVYSEEKAKHCSSR